MPDLSVFRYATILVGGMILLWWSGEKAVQYSQEASYLFGFSTFFIGFVLLGVSTGLPEIAIAVTSAVRMVPSLSAGTIIGSNLADIAMVLGGPVLLVGSIYVEKDEYRNLTLMLFINTLIMAGVFIAGTLTKIHGFILLAVFFYCLWLIWRTRYIKKIVKGGAVISKDAAKRTIVKSKVAVLTQLLLSMTGLIISAELSVRSSIALADIFYFSLEKLGATVFAIGTSLPELSVSLVALRKKEPSLALGNALGSVLVNGTLILGMLILASHTTIDIISLRPIAPFLFLSFGIIGYGIIYRRKVNRFEGLLLSITYLVFIGYYYFKPAFLS